MGLCKFEQRINAFLGRLFGACLALCVAGCAESEGNNDSAGQAVAGEQPAAVATEWLYFTADGSLVKAGHPSEIPSPGFKPWTEAVAVMDAGIADGSPVLLVNKKGVLSAESISPLLAGPSGTSVNAPFQAQYAAGQEGIFPSAEVLSAGTAAALVLEGGQTFVRFYRSSVFDDDRTPQPVALFLCGDAPYFPLTASVTAMDFGARRDAQFVSLSYAGGSAPWLASFKSRAGTSSGVSFEYFAFSAMPGSAGFSSRSLSTNEFQEISASALRGNPPEAFSRMLALLPGSFSVSLQAAGEGFPATCIFARVGDGEPLAAWGFVNEGMAAVLFADGTLYFSAAEREGPVKAMRFPRLNGGYAYTSLAFSREWILAGWEEKRFYETGRSGIIAVLVPDGFFS